IVLAIIEWGRLDKTLRDQIEKIILKEKDNISKKEVFKKIFPKVFANFFIETAKTLTTLCILGVLGIAIGANKLGNINLNNGWDGIYNYYPEWSGMLNIARKAIVGENYWLALFPLIGFTLSIIGFNLVGEGILYEVEEDYTIFYNRIKVIGHHL